MISFKDSGIYAGSINKWALSESKGKGTPQIILYVQVEAELNGNDKIECPSSEKQVYLYLAANTVQGVIEDLRLLGWEGSDFTEFDPDSPKAFDLTQKEVKLRCTFEDYKGKQTDKWQLALRAIAAKPLEKNKINQLNTLFAAQLKVGAKPKAANRSPSVRPTDDGDVV